MTNPIQRALAAVEPVVTRSHREMAFNARWPDEAYSNPTLKWLDSGLKSNGDNLIVFQECERIALALATVEHNARPKWILASAELPDSDVRVLVRGTDGDIVSAELEFTDDSEGHGEPYWAAGDSGDLSFCNYPHWMPRPADPPLGGASDV